MLNKKLTYLSYLGVPLYGDDVRQSPVHRQFRQSCIVSRMIAHTTDDPLVFPPRSSSHQRLPFRLQLRVP